MAAPRLVTLSDGVAEAAVAPDLGGGLASYDLVGAAGRTALFRPCRDLSWAGPFDLANNLLVPWSNRRARVLWPERSLELDVTADPQLSTYIAYSPSAKADFFRFEPVTHSVDAHNLPGDPVANGLAILAPQETVSAACRFSPRRLN